MSQLVQRLSALLARHKLDEASAPRFLGLLDLLASAPDAPTSVADPVAALDVHVADSLAALEVEALHAAHSVADLGSGAGFPGLALALALPHTAVELIESNARRCDFLTRAIAATGASNARVVGARAEEAGRGGPRANVVTARALADLPVVLEYAAPLLRPGGTLVAWRGARDAPAEARAAQAAPVLGLAAVEVRPVQPYPGSHSRHLHVFAKVGDTPPRFPRREGMAAKRPLGSD